MSYVQSGFKKVGSLPKTGPELKIKNHEALDSMMKGVATKDHVDVLIAAFNMAEAMYRINPELGENQAEAIKAAQDAIHSMGRRGHDKGKFLFTGPELQAVRFAMDVHDFQLDKCMVRELEQSIDLVNKMLLNRQARRIVETT